MIWLLIGYMYLFIHRPFEIWPLLGTFRVELLYMLLTGGLWLVWPNKRFSANPSHIAMAVFAGTIVLCSLASRWADQSAILLEAYLKILVFYLVLVTTIHDRRQLRMLILAYLVCMTIYMLHSAYEFHCGRYISRMGISRMIGIGQSWSDPNAFATSVLLSMVFVPAVWKAFPGDRRIHLGLLAFLLLGTYCIIRTGSRGAFVGLVLWIGLAVAASRHRFLLAAAMTVVLPIAWFAMPPSLQNRFETIIDPSVGPKNAQASAEGRIEGFLVGMTLWQENPLTGVGPGVWRVATGRELESHNLYGQLLGETGTLGGLAFLGLLTAFVLNIRAIWRRHAEHPHWPRGLAHGLAGCIGFAVFLLLLEGNFGHNLFRYNWPWFAAFLAITRDSVDQEARDEAEAGPSHLDLDEPMDEEWLADPVEEYA